MTGIRQIRERLRTGTEEQVRAHARGDIEHLLAELSRALEDLALARLDNTGTGIGNTITGPTSGTVIQTTGDLHGNVHL